MQAIGRQPQRAPDGAPVHYERHRPEQVEAPATTHEALQTVLHKVITRTMKLLTRR